MLNPISTYRIQFHKDFTFKDLDRIIPYLEQLGINTLYASPILEASPGSMHGYDTVNPHQINPEIGTLAELRAIAKKLQQLGIRWIQDIVPNHMAFHQNNIWLMDVLEKGSKSAYSGFFDINWQGDENLPLMVPFLGSTLEEAIAKGELKLVMRGDQIKLQYHETEWPVNDRVKDTSMPVQQAVDLQYYRPCSWTETNHTINYRRFFTVNSLICLNIQHEEVFIAYHQLIKSLLDEGIFQGLRVDHIDGLYDPEGYLSRLRELAGEETYIIIEKIIEEGEEISSLWPVQGNTGYDFLAQVNNLFTAQAAKKELTRYYEELTGDDKSIIRQIRQKKAGILGDYMAGELDNLYTLFVNLELADQQDIDVLKPGSLQDAIGQLLICCPVYRYYGAQLPLAGDNLEGLQKLFEEIDVVKPIREAAALLRHVLLKRPEEGDAAYNARATTFYLRCMQFSGPLMAKGVEDTLMYTYNRFVGHNEVGDSPEAFGAGRKVFHNQMWKRQKNWPFSLNGTSTHDTKRGEDTRARLNVLSDLPKEWIAKVEQWRKLNTDFSSGIDPNDEYFIYQTLIGSYPMPGMPEDNYPERVSAYLEKALREGKVNSNWAEPDMSYEQLVMDFVHSLLDQNSGFWNSFIVLHRKVSDFGIINSLGQLLLKFTCPGIPDVYQGTELWDLSLVDPDNRRPVDYQQRLAWLNEIKESSATLAELWKERYNGKIKLLLEHVLLQVRKLNPEILASGTYIPLEVKGKYADHIFAFARRSGVKWIITVIPLHLAKMDTGKADRLTELNWKDTRVELPAEMPLTFFNLLSGEDGELEKAVLPVSVIFKDFPLGLIELEQLANERAAGVLLSATSLPSAYGIGDLGPEARKFIDFLAHSGQKYWQLLPLNPVGADQSFSPYSSVSAMAGNTLLISPELLVSDGLLEEEQISKHEIIATGKTDFVRAADLKDKLLGKAYKRFNALTNTSLLRYFDAFCEKEQVWLDDFALYMVLKKAHGNAAWFEWKKEYSSREPKSLELFAADHKEELRIVKWKQFIFFRQWAALREYAAVNGVKLYGDLPFYVSHDSVEVWSNREFFSLDADGQMTGIAGVPPDYFNADGQLWGMPVYCWDQLKADGYQWWVRRIRKNMELYDLLRLDHFRAFADYWEVPAGETTAINGEWKTGPGSDFFKVLRTAFPDLPFIAEDLGKISPEVFLLRDEFGLAGMKVLQFAFGADISVSEHIPHRFDSSNFVVYTGTHDNDTTIGWYDHEAGKTERKHMKQYTGGAVTRNNVHHVLSRMAYASVARIVILPMQDILGLDGEARMNMPASIKGNWTWRMKGRPGKDIEKRLRSLVKLYGRS